MYKKKLYTLSVSKDIKEKGCVLVKFYAVYECMYACMLLCTSCRLHRPQWLSAGCGCWRETPVRGYSHLGHQEK